MVKARLKVGAAGFGSTLLILGSGLAGAASNNPHNRVSLCHSTGSQTNAFVKITVNANGTASGHAGSQHQGGRDIIPPFDYEDNGTKHFPGQNWNAQGQATFSNNCVATNGGQGGGNPETPGQVTNTTVTTGGLGAGVTQTPQGAVAAGGGGGQAMSKTAAVGLGGSLLSVITGLILSGRRKLV
jgi:hypothetical protein